MATYALLKAALMEAPIVPVITIDELKDAVPLAGALYAGGFTVLEVTLRTPAALDALAAMKDAYPDLIIGAGTICQPEDVHRAVSAGSDFLVSPGTSPALTSALLGAGVPAIPGTATASEAMSRAADGFKLLKLFPAVPVGGLALLKSLNAPLPDIHFMPTGGIREDTAPDFLALPNVIAVGGSWMVNKTDIAAGHWQTIEAKAKATARMIGQNR